MIKTRASRRANRMAARVADLESGRWLGVVPPSTVLRNNCVCRNYGRNRTNENMRREEQQGEPHRFKPEDYAA